MSGRKFTIHETLPPVARRRGKRASRYDPYIEAAIGHEGKWIRLDALASRDAKVVHSAGNGVRTAAARTQERLNFKGGFRVAVRQVDGVWYPFLLKRSASHAD